MNSIRIWVTDPKSFSLKALYMGERRENEGLTQIQGSLMGLIIRSLFCKIPGKSKKTRRKCRGSPLIDSIKGVLQAPWTDVPIHIWPNNSAF